MSEPTPSVPVPLAAPVDARHQPRQWPLRDKLRRVAWMFVQTFLFRPSFHNWYGWRRLLLRAMGAKVGRGVRVRPTARVEIPWNLDLGDDCVVGDYAILYSLGTIRLGRRVTVSQYAHLCAGTHDSTDPTFPLLRPPVVVKDDAWVAAEAFVGPGVTVGERAVLGARAVAVKDVPPDQVWAGNPARYIKPRGLRG
jgi:putative colanic acid biosynthesis acetyltransferase WcaF